MLFLHSLPRAHISSFFFFNDTATTEIYTLSLHDALPIFAQASTPHVGPGYRPGAPKYWPRPASPHCGPSPRSEEHTSELQSHLNLVCRLLLEKKKKNLNILFAHPMTQRCTVVNQLRLSRA